MATLTSMKLITAKKPINVSATQIRRNKMLKRIWEQMQLAKAQQNGTTFTLTRLRTVIDRETGIRKQLEVPKRIKPWWFIAENGKTALAVRYGPRVIELSKGKFAVEIATPNDLLNTLELIKVAVESGELDAQLEITAGSVRSNFKR